jgi:hypothetical protein
MTRVKIHLPPYFVKFGKGQNIMELRNNGIVYFNPLSFFKNIENDEVRNDELEGALRIEQVREIQLYSEGEIIARQLPGSNAQLYFHDKENNGKVFSLYAITEEKHTDQDFVFDDRLLKFGDKLLLITNTKIFIERIIRQIKSRNLKFNLGYVNYYDKNMYSGSLNPFQKPDVFKYQYEFRVFIESCDQLPMKIEIGSIKNISQILDSPAIEKMKIVSAKTMTKNQLKEIKTEINQQRPKDL